MPVQTTNIIVGPGNLFIAERTGGAFPALPDFTTPSGTAYAAFEATGGAASAWTYLGATEGGVELSYEPTYTDINIDQYKDAARQFLETQTINISTTLMESTLANLIYVWGFEANTHLVDTVTPSADGISQTFNLGILGEDPCEYAVGVVSKGVGTQPNCVPGTGVERVYVARRVVSVQGSTFGMRRTEATMFPVTFRLLPDDTAPANEEYGTIFDRDPLQATG